MNQQRSSASASPALGHAKFKEEKRDLEYESMDEGSCKSIMQPVTSSLHKLHKGSKGLDKHEWAKILKSELLNIGDFIESEVSKVQNKDKLRKHLWSFTGLYWPSKVPSNKIGAMYNRLKQSN